MKQRKNDAGKEKTGKSGRKEKENKGRETMKGRKIQSERKGKQ